jgi:hypothetical protein
LRDRIDGGVAPPKPLTWAQQVMPGFPADEVFSLWLGRPFYNDGNDRDSARLTPGFSQEISMSERYWVELQRGVLGRLFDSIFGPEDKIDIEMRWLHMLNKRIVNDHDWTKGSPT